MLLTRRWEAALVFAELMAEPVPVRLVSQVVNVELSPPGSKCRMPQRAPLTR
jgi:hypothetical protein